MYNQKPLLGTLPNYVHPLTPNVASWIINEGSGNKIYDIIEKNHGTFGAGAAAPTWKPGGIYFGGNDYIDCGISSSLNMGSGNFTISVEIKFSGAGEYAIAGKGATHEGGKRYVLLANNGNLRLSVDDNVTKKTVISANTYNDSINHYLVGIRDGNNLRLYIDGTEDANSPIDITGMGSLDSPRICSIGAMYNEILGAMNTFFLGTINEAMIYNRALNASEIQQLYINPHCWLAQPMGAELMYVAPPVGAIINQFQKANLGADLYDGVLIT